MGSGLLVGVAAGDDPDLGDLVDGDLDAAFGLGGHGHGPVRCVEQAAEAGQVGVVWAVKRATMPATSTVWVGKASARAVSRASRLSPSLWKMPLRL